MDSLPLLLVSKGMAVTKTSSGVLSYRQLARVLSRLKSRYHLEELEEDSEAATEEQFDTSYCALS